MGWGGVGFVVGGGEAGGELSVVGGMFVVLASHWGGPARIPEGECCDC